MMTRADKVFTGVATVVVVAAVAWGIVLAGTPGQVRMRRYDAQRLDDLRAVHREIQALCVDPEDREALKRALPATLEELAEAAFYERIRLADPETGEPYRYRVVNETTYELCATFATERDADEEVFWNHGVGEKCFLVDALDGP